MRGCQPRDRADDFLGHGISAVTFMIHHDELAIRHGFVEPPGGHKRTAHVESAVDQDGGEVSNAVHPIQKRRNEGGVLPVVDDQCCEDLALLALQAVPGIDSSVKASHTPGHPCLPPGQANRLHLQNQPSRSL
jgi:hypothetical protein